jgi:hypothetical protein
MDTAAPQYLEAGAGLAPLALGRHDLPRDFRAQKEIGDYYVELTPTGEDLVLSFENADDSNPEPNRLPWGYNHLREQGVAVLGVKTKRSDWYRGRELHDFFRSEDLHALVGSYRKVLFYGSSMGGFAALTFCTPGALVLAHNPQTSLDPELTPWDSRYPEGKRQDWSGDFARAWDGARLASQVFATYDPFLEVDRRHVERLDPANLVPLKAPFLGHSLPSYLRRIGLLGDLVPLALSSGLTSEWWYGAIRKRRELARYLLLMSDHVRTPEAAALLLARAWKASAKEVRTQDRIRRHATNRKLGELFERYLVEGESKPAIGPAGPDEELFRRFMANPG